MAVPHLEEALFLVEYDGAAEEERADAVLFERGIGSDHGMVDRADRAVEAPTNSVHRVDDVVVEEELARRADVYRAGHG